MKVTLTLVMTSEHAKHGSALLPGGGGPPPHCSPEAEDPGGGGQPTVSDLDSWPWHRVKY